MKFCLAVLYLLSACFTAYGALPDGQEETASGYDNEKQAESSGWMLGPMIGGEMFGVGKHFDKVSNDFFGFSGAVGGNVRYKFDRHWFVQGSLTLDYGRTLIMLNVLEKGMPPTVNSHVNRFAAHIPIQAGYLFGEMAENQGISINAGLGFNLGLAGKIDSTTYTPSLNLYGNDGVMNRFGLSLCFGATIHMKKCEAVIRGDIGLTPQGRGIYVRHGVTEFNVLIGMAYMFHL
ncbi:MAG: PorT family protein [Muribaculaceae bacterium]|nr:PorT family protein [Muribaculaceae bacterium]